MTATAFADRVYCNVATTGQGTITIGSAAANNVLTPIEASMVDGKTYAYVLEEGLDFEAGFGVYTASGTTLTRATVKESKIAGVAGTTKMTLAGAAKVRITSLADDLTQILAAVSPPQLRLSLTSAVPITTTDVTGATTIYAVPQGGQICPVYDGTQFNFKNIGSALSLALDGTLAHAQPHVTNGIFDLFVIDDAGTIRLGTGPMWQKTSTVTMTIASPAVVTWNAHGLADGAPIVFTTSGALPTGLTAGTIYFVKSPTTNTFNVAATAGGSAINTTGSQSGTHTAVACDPLARGTGAGTTELELYNGINVNKNSMTVRFGSSSGNTVVVAARKATYVGSFKATADGQASDTLARRLLDNAYNRAERILAKSSPADHAYSTASYRALNNDQATNHVEVLLGLVGLPVKLKVINTFGTSTSTVRQVQVGIGLDSSTVSAALPRWASGSSAKFEYAEAEYWGHPGLGYHEFNWLEYGAGADTQTFYQPNSYMRGTITN